MSIKDELNRRLETDEKRKASLYEQQDAARRLIKQNQEHVRELGRKLGIEGAVREAHEALKQHVRGVRYSDGVEAIMMSYRITFPDKREVRVLVTPKQVAVFGVSGLRPPLDVASFDLAEFERLLADVLLEPLD